MMLMKHKVKYMKGGREADMPNQLKEFAERESKLRADFVALNNKMDTWQVQVDAHSLAHILAATGMSSMESLDLGRLLNLVRNPATQKLCLLLIYVKLHLS